MQKVAQRVVVKVHDPSREDPLAPNSLLIVLLPEIPVKAPKPQQY